MANLITIDIVAETNKLTSGINDANGQIDGMSNKLKGAAAAAGAAASAFVLKQGITFLKQGIDEAKEAQEVMRGATTTFGEGSAALQKITEDADKFGKAIAVDNDEIIKLSTQLGSRLPADAKALSAEIINTAFDIEAYTAGAITAEAVSGKLAKAFVDGELSAKELAKIYPDLNESVYAQAEALSKAGKNQEALTLLNDAAQKKYGDAAEKNVTATQKFETALANFKEELGTKVLPILEKGVDFLTKVLDAFDKLPGPVQNLVIGLVAVVGIGVPFLAFLASARTSLVTLGLATDKQTASQVGLNTAMSLNPISIVIIAIAALIAIGVLLWKNWDTVTEYAGKLWKKIQEVFGWVKENWPLLLAILTGPIGLAVKYIIDNFDDIKDKARQIVKNITDFFGNLPDKMLSIGRDIVSGIWNGMKSMAGWLKDKVFDFFGNLIPGWAKKVLGISSPSKVFARYGRFIVEGLALGIQRSADLAKAATEGLGLQTIGAFGGIQTPQLATGTRNVAPVTVNINAGLGTDPYELGRVVDSALKKYGSVSGRF